MSCWNGCCTGCARRLSQWTSGGLQSLDQGPLSREDQSFGLSCTCAVAVLLSRSTLGAGLQLFLTAMICYIPGSALEVVCGECRIRLGGLHQGQAREVVTAKQFLHSAPRKRRFFL
jgi:hypothetical protein